MSKQCVWVVEARPKNRPHNRWRQRTPSIFKRPAINLARDWRNDNPLYEFRVTKYVPVKP